MTTLPDFEPRPSDHMDDANLAAKVAGHTYDSGSYDLSVLQGALREVIKAARKSTFEDGSAQTIANFGRRLLQLVEPELNQTGELQ